MKKRTIYFTLFILMQFCAFAQVPTNGLVAYYPFNGNANDWSNNGNNGVVNGATLTTDRNGISNSAYSFNGSDYIEIPSSSSLNPTNQLTISVWVKVNSFTNRYTPILHKGGANPGDFSNREYCMYVEDNGNMFTESAGSINRVYSHTAFPTDNTWSLYVAVIDRVAHTLTIYLNGIQKAQVEDLNDSFMNNNQSLKLGSWDETNSEYAQFFSGSLDDIRIYNRALDATEVQALYNESSDATYYYNKGFEDGQAACVATKSTEILKSSEINVYPNPTKGNVIVNVNGIDNSLDLTEQANGFYIVNILDISGKTVKTVKIVKQ